MGKDCSVSEIRSCRRKINYQLEWEIATKYGLVVDKGVGVFNGDIGIVTAIHTYDETVEVEFDEKMKGKISV